MSFKKKIAFFHGFLGGPKDMEPLCLEGYEFIGVDLRKFIFKSSYVEDILSFLSEVDVALGYSFGGRILEELVRKDPFKFKKIFLISSRHTVYSLQELKERETFRKKLESLLIESRGSFNKNWDSLDLFSGHLMNDYRKSKDIELSPWSDEEIFLYLKNHFNSPQVKPRFNKDVVYIYGENDFKYKKESSQLGCRTFEVKDAGHRVLFEKSERVKKIIREVLDVL